MGGKRILLTALCLVISASLLRCSGEKTSRGAETVIVFKHGKLSGEPEAFRKLLRGFEDTNPGILVKDEVLPASTDEQHQFYVINLEGGSSDFDVLAMDVIWIPEFARAGWLREIGGLFTEREMDDLFPGPRRAVTFNGKVYAMPWYIDAGVLYYRKDLLGKYGLAPPDTWMELVHAARHITAREHGLYGFIWQGKQYEGLVCNALEYFWGNGGDVMDDGRVVLRSRENARALSFMRDLIVKYGVSPGLVTTSIEEPGRHIFGSGKAVFMRNWPYAWKIFEREGSPVRGRVGVTTLPAFKKGMSYSTLGGWQLGINRFSKNPDGAMRLLKYLTSPVSQKYMALHMGYRPPARSLYRDRDLVEDQPFTAGLYLVFMKARPRPVSPYYMMMTQVLQPELSAALAGIKSPDEALRAAEYHIAYILGAEK
jgi:multiple sugar transport system substrate-binding protein